jgi:DNA processing protein
MLLPQEQTRHWLAALRLPDIGPIKFLRLLNHFGDITSLYSAALVDWQAAGLTPPIIQALQTPPWAAVESDLAWSQQPNCHILTLAHPNYPPLLRETPGAPLVLYLRGQPEHLSKPQLAIVGSRNPTAGGRESAQQFAYCLAQAGLVITSGLALGIDAAGHRGALNASAPTIAVMGTGLKHIYPGSHQKLAADIIQQGVLVSEFPPDTLAVASNFPRRNRIISGLSLGVLVVEAALRSGSLITARFAAEQGRDVFAMPGSIHNPLARGCHQLIQQGAKLVEKAQDIIEELAELKRLTALKVEQSLNVSTSDLSPKQLKLLTKIDHEPATLDTIIVRSGLTAAEVSSMLLLLELQGYVLLVSGGYARVPAR